MKSTKIKSYAKLNLALNITGKSSSLHKIESLVAFISLSDEIFIKKINSKSHRISFIGEFSQNIPKINTVFRLLQILEKKETSEAILTEIFDRASTDSMGNTPNCPSRFAPIPQRPPSSLKK